jgi:murein DD-endopeptidase MepM/ murein hydrolase activator NlpD
MRSFWPARALLVGLWLSFGVHLPVWSRDAKPGNLYSLLPIWIPGGNRDTQDWRAVVQSWNPGNPFCIVRVVCFPVQAKYVIPPGGQLFASRPGRFHAGEDYSVPYGSAVYSAFNGVVTKTFRNLGACGDGLEIKTGHFIQRFCHAEPQVATGQRVYAGQVVAKVNMSGRTSGPHLHVETYVNGQIVSFEKFLKNLPETAKVIAASGVEDQMTNTLAQVDPTSWAELSNLLSERAKQGGDCRNPGNQVVGWGCYVLALGRGVLALKRGNNELKGLPPITPNEFLQPSQVPEFVSTRASLSQNKRPNLKLPFSNTNTNDLQRRITTYPVF